MKKILILLLAVGMIFCASTVFSMPIYIDVGAAGSAGLNLADSTSDDDNTLVDLFYQITYHSDTTTIQYDTDDSKGLTINDEFSDSGNLYATGYSFVDDTTKDGDPAEIDGEGINLVYEITAEWTGLKGWVTDVETDSGTNDTRIDVFYDTGTINFYLDTDVDHSEGNPAGTDPPAGAGGTGYGLDVIDASATLIGTLNVLEGIGHTFIDFSGGGTDVEDQGSVELLLEFTYMLEGFWFDEFGNDLEDIPVIQWNLLTTDSNIDTPGQVPAEGALYTAYSNQDGSVEITVVPEPSTALLLGSGLLGLVFVSRSRLRKRD